MIVINHREMLIFLVNVCSIVLQLLLEHAEAIAPDHTDPIHAILKDLGSSPSIENLLGKFNPRVITDLADR